MRMKTPPEAINREALLFGLMVGVIATTAMTLIGGMNFLLAGLAGLGLAVVVWFVVVKLGKDAPPPRGEGNLDPAPELETPAAPTPKPNMPEQVVEAPKRQAAPAATPAPEGGSDGEKPEALASARDGGPDDLKQIKGVGPKLEKLLHSLGVYHFDQIAGWTPAHVAWMDENLEGFKGRVSRDDWIGQAKDLA